MARTNPTARPNHIRNVGRLWHNLGNGKFEDATQKAGLYESNLKRVSVSPSSITTMRMARHLNPNDNATQQALPE